jgi:outer membrane immunogenic protein
MNKFIVSSVALVASLAGSAMAADMPIRPPVVVVESWTGFYAGVALGGRFSDSKWATNCLSAGAPGGVGCPLNFAANGVRFLTDNPAGLSSATFRPSVYLGYNWQVGNWVVGAEADVAYGQGNNSIKGIPGAENLVQAGSPGNDIATIKDSWDASARARAGFLITPTMLLYATGGASWIHLEASAFCGSVNPIGWCRGPAGPGSNVGTTSTVTTTRIGWTAGGGIEAMLWSNWLARIEYRYSDYGKFDYTLFSGVDAIAAETKFHTHTALVGVAYRFGGPVLP